MASAGTVRVDRWLWSVRVYRTRTTAASACRGGHVKINGRTAKPAATLEPGDRVSALVGRRAYDLEVVRLIEKRVGAPTAAECYVDHSPPLPERTAPDDQGRRERGAGRPTKRERRQLDRLKGRRP